MLKFQIDHSNLNVINCDSDAEDSCSSCDELQKQYEEVDEYIFKKKLE